MVVFLYWNKTKMIVTDEKPLLMQNHAALTDDRMVGNDLISITSRTDEASDELEPPEHRVNALLNEVGLAPEAIAPRIKDRLVLLEKITPTIEDETAAIAMARGVFDTAEIAGRAYTEEEQREVIIGTLFTDIGKSGPLEATPKQSRIIAKMYAIENIPEDDVFGSVEAFLSKYFSNNEDVDTKAELRNLGLDIDNLKMRDFYNLHTKWTLEILLGDGVPKEAIPAAAAHHHMRGDNPDSILNKRDEYNSGFDFGQNHTFDRPEKLVSILDMYDAYRRRSKLSHESAMVKIRSWVNTTDNRHYADDSELDIILEDLDKTILDPIPA